MSGALRKSSPYWRKSAEANGFGIVCIKDTDGERFSITLLDAGRFAKFAARGLRAGLSMTETELRAQLVQAGFSEPDIEVGIQLSRDWATLIKKSNASRN